MNTTQDSPLHATMLALAADTTATQLPQLSIPKSAHDSPVRAGSFSGASSPLQLDPSIGSGVSSFLRSLDSAFAPHDVAFRTSPPRISSLNIPRQSLTTPVLGIRSSSHGSQPTSASMDRRQGTSSDAPHASTASASSSSSRLELLPPWRSDSLPTVPPKDHATNREGPSVVRSGQHVPAKEALIPERDASKRPMLAVDTTRQPLSTLASHNLQHFASPFRQSPTLATLPLPDVVDVPTPVDAVSATRLDLASGPAASMDFLNFDPIGDKKASSTANEGRQKGKQRSEVPIMELRVLSITDQINMFGSTQTSSNYSLSGKVVVRVHNVVRQRRSSRSPAAKHKGATRKASKSASPLLPEIDTDGAFLDPDEFFASQTDYSDTEDGGAPSRVQEVRVMSLSCTFSGFALYADHSGRFAACRLAEVTEDLLPNGFTVSIPPLGKSQEYEIEFNISVPGWLPASLYTRFGGTFYSLEARAKYSAIDSEQQHAIPSSLVPPRRGSMFHDSSSDGNSDSEGVPLHWQGMQRRNGPSVASPALGPAVKGRTASGPATPGKASWLGKSAKRLASMTRSATSGQLGELAAQSSSAGALIDAPEAPPPRDIHALPPKLFASRDHMLAFSDPLVIIVRRCREVVPVPVARLAIVGPDGRPDTAAQDAIPLDPPAPRPTTALRPRNESPLPPPPPPDDADEALPGPPVAPTAFDVPSDPSKAAAHLFSPPPIAAPTSLQAPHRRSSVPDHAPSHGVGPNGLPVGSTATGSNVPMRHFLHRPMLHPPAEANIPNSAQGLPFSLTLSLPSYVAVDGPDGDILTFGVQIEVGRSPMWTRVRELGGLRLRDMELSCIQSERHCSLASRTFCHAYPLPPEPQVDPYDLPVFVQPGYVGPHGRPWSSVEHRLRRGYDRAAVQHHLDLVEAGQAPHPGANNVERVRTVVVGPPPQPVAKAPAPRRTMPGEEAVGNHGKGKERSGEPIGQRRRTLLAAASLGDLHRAHNEAALQPASPARAGRGWPSTSGHRSDADDSGTEEAFVRNGRGRGNSRGRRAYQSAIRGLSNLVTSTPSPAATASGPTAMDPPCPADGRQTADRHRSQYGGPHTDAPTGPDAGQEPPRAALYSFAGSDGHGVDLTRGRVRMSIKLPLVTSDASRARACGMPQLIPDFESPFTKTRHKLQVKLGFGFGSKPLGGDGEWGQSLVMCVPVRFTEAAPREVREQFAPLPVRQVAKNGVEFVRSSHDEGPAEPPVTLRGGLGQPAVAPILTVGLSTSNVEADPLTPGGSGVAPILPSYNQLFREDGSRLADEGEDLPQYPGPRVVQPAGGSVTAASMPDGFETMDEAGLQARLDTGDAPAWLAPTAMPMSQRSSSLPIHVDAASSQAAGAGSSTSTLPMSRILSHDNRIAPMRVLDESIPSDQRGNASRALQRVEMEEMHQEEQREAEVRRIRRVSGHLEGGLHLANGASLDGTHLDVVQTSLDPIGSGAESGQEGNDASDADLSNGRMDETVHVDDLDVFDDEVPAFALRRDGQTHGTARRDDRGPFHAAGRRTHHRDSMMPTVTRMADNPASPMRTAPANADEEGDYTVIQAEEE